MLSELKFIPRDQIDKAQAENRNDSRREKKTCGSKKGKDRRKKKSSHYSSSDDDLEKLRKRSKKGKKWYASDDDLSSNSVESESESDSDQDKKKRSCRKKEKGKERGGRKNVVGEDFNADNGGSDSGNYSHIKRKEMGLDWMLRPKENAEGEIISTSDHLPEEPQAEEIKKPNPKELNPYLKNNGRGYAEDSDGTKAERNHLLSSGVVGDGGASWRLKALKRAQEQAAREGRSLGEVVENRWGSLSQLAVPVASRTAAPSHAHLHAIKNRKRGLVAEQETVTDNQNERVPEKPVQDVSRRHPKMRVPKLHDSLTWGKRKSQSMSTKDDGLISSALSSINKFANDGGFMREIMHQKNNDSSASLGSSCAKSERDVESKVISLESEKPTEDGTVVQPTVSANQLAAKALQLRMKGKLEEAEKLLDEAKNLKTKKGAGDESSRLRNDVITSRHIKHDMFIHQKKKEEDADMHLAQKIVRNQKYSISSRADDEYDHDDGPSRKTRKKLEGNDHKATEITSISKRILTQQERCQFCFENPTRPKHLVVAIANFTYLSLPHWQHVVPGHCWILPMQHEAATRTVDNNVWDEIRNFKKCLTMMFAKQEKDLVFLETVMGLAQQRRHCFVECIPLPRETAKQAPLYFKKAIDEAEDEWSQHNAKKLIDTSEKGLRASIPKDFPYFHVEFGLNKGFAHVIDDEKQFKSNLGLNVIRGMLRLPAEDMYGRRKHESVETQREVVASFAKDWEPFDWTKQLD